MFRIRRNPGFLNMYWRDPWLVTCSICRKHKFVDLFVGMHRAKTHKDAVDWIFEEHLNNPWHHVYATTNNEEKNA